MDSIIILFLVFVTVCLKCLFIDNYCHNILRKRHSKSYIKKHYKGLANKIFYVKYIKEIGVVPVIVNYILLFIFIALIILFFVSLFPKIQISYLIDDIIFIYMILFCLLFIYDSIKFIVFNKDAKNQKCSIGYRVIYLLVFIVIMYCIISNIV